MAYSCMDGVIMLKYLFVVGKFFVVHAGTGVRSVSKFHNAEQLSLKF